MPVRDRIDHGRGTGPVCVCVCVGDTHVCISTCIWQTGITGQVLFFWKILEVCPQGICSEVPGPFKHTLFVFQIRGP